MTIARGDILLGALSGDFGKPRPLLVIQTDVLNETHPSLLVCPITTHITLLKTFRLAVDPNPDNGLLERSEIMVDKVSAIARARLGRKIGFLSPAEIVQVEQILRFMMQLQ